MEEGEVDVEGHAEGPEDVHAEEHLDGKGLELAEGGVGAGGNAILSNQAGNVHAQVRPRGEENEAVDGLVEATSEEKGGEDEEDAEEGEDRGNTFSDLEGIDL